MAVQANRTSVRPSTPATEIRGRDGIPERAVLVGVDLGARSRGNHAAQAGARQAAVRAEPESADFPLNQDAIDSAAGAGVSAARAATLRSSTELDAEESLAEFRELVASAADKWLPNCSNGARGLIRPR